MAVMFSESKTKENLMRAFAGESQARNRYTFAAGQAKKEGLYVVEALFRYTADQEKEHAEIFYNLLHEEAGKNIEIDGSYPVDISNSVIELLRKAQHNEYEEAEDVYLTFGQIALEEGFPRVASAFHEIRMVEKRHGDRFGRIADMLEDNTLFVSGVLTKWICLNCGTVIESRMAPPVCPTCHHEQGYFIRLELSPFEGCEN